MSADGNVIIGNILDRFSFQKGCVWRAPLFECEVIGEDLMDNGYSNNFVARVSNNGEWVTGPVTKTADNTQSSYRYSVVDGTIEVLVDLQNRYGGSCIANDGTIYCYTQEGMAMMGRIPFIQRPGMASISLFEHMLAEHEIDMTMMSNSCTIMDAPENTFAGFGMDDTNGIGGFVARMDNGAGIGSAKSAKNGFFVKNNCIETNANRVEMHVYGIAGNLIKKSNANRLDLNGLNPGVY